MPELTRGPFAWLEVHRSSDKRMFPACVSRGLHLVEWTRHIVDLSYFVSAQVVYSTGCRLQLTSQLVLLKASVHEMIKPGGKFLNCKKLIIHQPGITCKGKAKKHQKWGDLTRVKLFAPFHTHVNDGSTEITSQLLCAKFLKRHKQTCRSCFEFLPPGQRCIVAARRNVSSMRKPWPTSCGMDQTHCGPFIVRSCSSGAFIWLQVGVNLAARSLKSVSAQDDKSRRKIPEQQ